MKSPFLVGVAGGSGSGKTLFASAIKDKFEPSQVEIFSLDNYYKPIEEQPVDEWGVANFDRPESFYREKLKRDLENIKKGNDIEIPKYNFNINRGGKPEMIVVKAAPIVIVEGLFTFSFEEIVPLLDVKLFVDVPIWLMMKRRIQRDETERGYGDLKETMDRYENHVIPAFNEFVNYSKKDADLIIPNHTNFDQALDIFTTYLKAKIARN